MIRSFLKHAGFAVVALAAGIALAPAAEPENEFGLLLGITSADKNVNNDEDSALGPLVGLRYAHFFSDDFSWFADTTLSFVNRDGAAENLDYYTLRTGPEFYLTPANSLHRWFVAPSIGVSRLEFDANAKQRPFAGLGVGGRFETGTGAAMWQIRGEQLFGKKWSNDKGVFMAHALLGFMWGSTPPRDTDGDGVFDRQDKCPGTPAGAKVDAKGCPTDSDGDGVFDGLDRCPDTPKGWPVDATGCTPDTDGDGVVDPSDKCPGTPAGSKVDANGCVVDSDGDGVPDDKDRCPNSPRGSKVDATGCPPDSDGDGVPDDKDACPNTPRGAKVDATGCVPPPPPPPKAAPLFTGEAKTLVLEGVLFDTNKATLRPESIEILDRVAASLRDWPEVKVEVGGHTDARGSNALNDKLSAARAAAVREYLVSKGIDGSRLTSKGYGKRQPIADNNTDEGRQKNRRVELKKLD